LPKSRVEFWEQKLRANKERDLNAINALVSDGWQVIVVWECALKGKNKISDEVLISSITNILRRSKEKRVYHLRGSEIFPIPK
jgi:DNA mismatch endonuclease (patch repair protein)